MNPKTILAITTAVAAGGALALERMEIRKAQKEQRKFIQQKLEEDVVAIQKARDIIINRIRRGEYNSIDEVMTAQRFETIIQSNY